MIVLFPEPLWPLNPTISFGDITNDAPFNIQWSLDGYLNQTSLNSIWPDIDLETLSDLSTLEIYSLYDKSSIT